MDKVLGWFMLDRDGAKDALAFWGFVLAYLAGFAAVLGLVAACLGVL